MNTPPVRRLRGYAFDPSLSLQIDTHQINEITYEVPWEEIKTSKGTIETEYLEIIDYDPTVDKTYDALDFNDTYVLAQHGLDPSESNPKFHQQMIYAVVMTTIRNFEKALGRKVLWSTRRVNSPEYEHYVGKLRIYPHALRQSNAYYSPHKKALLFGYFHSNPVDQSHQMPGSLVYTCLSHDIIAHETTHAILDGMQRHYNVPSNPDVLAFHEAFADIVALFQHFSFSDVLKHQIARTRGDLTQQNLLGELAQQFGVAIGKYGSLRNAIGKVNEETGVWEPITPDPGEYQSTLQPHKRGSILVAAVFEAFISMYNRKVADLYRIASGGTGILPKGELHPDLVNRLADEAAKVAQEVLNMCIRAIDYCPPVDITFGDYLRAIITADYDVEKEDVEGRRLAFIEAFRRRGIFPERLRSLSIESLRYPEIDLKKRGNQLMSIIGDFLRDYSHTVAYCTNREEIFDISATMIAGGSISNQRRNKKVSRFRIQGLHERFNIKFGGSEEFSLITGLAFLGGDDFGIKQSSRGNASFQITNLRLVNRVGPSGTQLNQVVFSILQRCGAILKNGSYVRSCKPDSEEAAQLEQGEVYVEYRGGCTFILDLDTRELKYLISKPLLIEDKDGRVALNIRKMEEQFAFMHSTDNLHMHEFQHYFGLKNSLNSMELFSLLHQD